MSRDEIKTALLAQKMLTDGNYYAQMVGNQFYVWTYIDYVYDDIEQFLDEITSTRYQYWESTGE